MKMLLSLFCFFSFIDVSWAQNDQRELFFADGSAQIHLLHGEKNRFFVDTFKVDANGWQERLDQKSFDDLKSAKIYFSKKTRGYSHSSTVRHHTFSKLRQASTPIWDVTNRWTAEWESKYTEWVGQNLDENFFVKYQIPTDCADVAFAIRWIFARINGLPAAATLAGTEQLFTQADGKASWANIPTSANWYEDERFRKALLYVMDNTYTHSLLLDSYPVEISPIGVQPGGYHLTVRTESGHTRMIYSVNPNDTALHAIRFVSSDVPSEVRVLYEEPFSLKKFMTKEAGGFLRFRWPQLNEQGQYFLVPENEMPNYSLEQYDKEFEKSYYNTVLKHMGISNKPDEFIRLRLGLAWQKLHNRVSVVEKGFAICSAENCEPGTVNYENWSTPNRDEQIRDLVTELLETYWQNSDDRKVQVEYDKWKDLTMDIGGGTGLTVRYEDLLMVWYNQTYSFDPRDGILLRWGY